MEYIGSYSLYLSAFAVSVLGSWRYYNRTKIKEMPLREVIFYFLIITGPIILLQGLRYDVGTDYRSYATLSEAFGNGNSMYIAGYTREPLFIIWSKLAYLVSSGNKYFFFFLDAVLMNTLLFFTFDYYKKEVNLPVLYIMYYFFCFPYFLNTERQGLAVIILWFSVRYVLEKRLVRFIACVVVAFLFHNTAIIGLVLYPAYYLLNSRKTVMIKLTLIIISLLSPLLFGISLSFLSQYISVFSKYTKFVNEVLETQVNVNWAYTLGMLVFLVPFMNILRRGRINLWWLVFLWIGQLSSYLLNIYIEWGFRMSFYFEIGMMYGYAFISSKLKKSSNRVFLNWIILGACVFHFTYKFFIRGNAEIFPYQTVFLIK